MIKFTNISFSYGKRKILKNVNITADYHDRIALTGLNGAGKTTLLKIIAGELEPLEGEIFVDRRLELGYFPQVLPKEEMTINEYLGNSSSRCIKMLKIFNLSDIPDNRQIKNLSGGEKTRLKLARLFYRQPDFLLLDEPTNNLDLKGLFWLESFLCNYTGGMIIVSHDRRFLSKVARSVWEISAKNHQVKIYPSYSDYCHKKRYQQDRSPQKTAKEESKEQDKEKQICFCGEKISFGYPGQGVLNNISFQATEGDRIALFGANGVGKTTLLKIIAEIYRPTEGTVIWSSSLENSYYSHKINNKEDLRLLCSKSNFLLLDEPTNDLDLPSINCLEEALQKFKGTFIVVSQDRSFLENIAVNKAFLLDRGKLLPLTGTIKEIISSFPYLCYDSYQC